MGGIKEPTPYVFTLNRLVGADHQVGPLECLKTRPYIIAAHIINPSGVERSLTDRGEGCL